MHPAPMTLLRCTAAIVNFDAFHAQAASQSRRRQLGMSVACKHMRGSNQGQAMAQAVSCMAVGIHEILATLHVSTSAVQAAIQAM
jgi:glycosyltransferase A (GT-A) superfamily protein (DUF2064 family)